MKAAIIVDIDGTIALKGDRSPYDWSKVWEDKVNQPILDLLWALEGAWLDIILVSGRDECCRKDTEAWLEKHNVPFVKLFMREEGDNEKDTVIKERIFRDHIASNYLVWFVLDDRDCVVKMWRDLGLTCLQVAEGGF